MKNKKIVQKKYHFLDRLWSQWV